MGRRILSFCFFFIACLLGIQTPCTASAEAPGINPARIELGFMGGYGSGGTTDGGYEPLLMMLHVGYTVKQFSWGGRLSLIAEPQYNLVFSPNREYEFGIGLGIEYMHPLFDRFNFYTLLTSGPHYISMASTDQASGFIFSSTAGAGFYYFVTPGAAVNAGYRVRHISNAGLKWPNLGINTHLGLVGISWFF